LREPMTGLPRILLPSDFSPPAFAKRIYSSLTVL
jgi:hypothetical protein